MAANKNNVTKRSDVNRPLTYVEGDTNFEELKNVITDQQSFESQQNTRNSTYETDISDLQIDTNTNTNDITGLRTDVDTDAQNLLDHENATDPHPQYATDTKVDGIDTRVGTLETSVSNIESGTTDLTVTSETGTENISVALNKRVEKGEVGSETVTTSTGTQSVTDALDQRGPVFDSVADMKTASGLTVGVKCRTLGYYEPGDGGGNDYEIVAGATGTDDGGSFIDLVGSGLQAKGLFPAGVNVRQFGARGDGSTDDSGSIQSAIDFGSNVYMPSGDYQAVGLVVDKVGFKIYGGGVGQTVVQGSDDTSPIFKFKTAYCSIGRMKIGSNASRRAVTNTTATGISFEPDDLPYDFSSLQGYMFNTDIHDLEIIDQPSSGIHVIAGIFNGSTLNRLRISSNRGHGIHIERGHLRTNVPAPVGLCHLNYITMFGNDGNGIALGNPSDTNTTQTIRIVSDNVDCGNCALDAGVRFGAYQFWAAGSGIEFNTCYTSDNQAVPTTAGIYIQGTNNYINSLRTNDVAPAVYVGENVPALPTNGIYIDGLNVLTFDIGDLSPAVEINPLARNVSVKTENMSNIAALTDTQGRGISVDFGRITRKKNTDQSVNNTTIFENIGNFYYSAEAGDECYFELMITHQSDASTGIKIDFDAPGATQFRWCTASGFVQAPSGTIDVQSLLVSNSSTIEAKSDTTRRVLFIKGYFNLTGDAGVIRPRFAQTTAVAGNTTILSPMSHFKVEKYIRVI